MNPLAPSHSLRASAPELIRSTGKGEAFVIATAADTGLDGKQAAAWSRKHNRRILNVVMKYAVRRRLLWTNLLPKEAVDDCHQDQQSRGQAVLDEFGPGDGSPRQHIEDERLKPGDLMFQGETGGILAGWVVRRAWRGACKAVLPPHVFELPTGKRVYDNCHTRLTKWLNDGIPLTQVAECAGSSAPVLPTYAT